MRPIFYILIPVAFWLFATAGAAQMEPFRVRAELAPSAPRLDHARRIAGRQPVQSTADEAVPDIGPGWEMPADDGPLFHFRLSDNISFYLSQHEGREAGRNVTRPAGETNTMSVWKTLPSLWQQGATRDALSTAAGLFEPEIGLGIAF